MADGFLSKIFGFTKSDSENFENLEGEDQIKINSEDVKGFAKKLVEDFKSRKKSDLNSEQNAILEEMQHQLKQFLKDLEKEGAALDKKLHEIAHEIFIISCASTLSMEEVGEFFAACGLNIQDLNKFGKSGKLNALAAALAGGRNKKYLQWLIANGANINFQSPDGNNLAHFAAMIGVEHEMMDFLIKEGADINATNKMGMTVLDLVMVTGHQELHDLLKENDGKSGLKSMLEEKEKGEGEEKTEPENDKELTREEQLHNAVLSGNSALVGSLITDGANVNAIQGGESILQTAAKTGNWTITAKVADRANVVTKENVRGVSDAMGQMIDNAGSMQARVENPFHHAKHNHHAADIKSQNNNSRGGGGMEH